MFYQIIEVGQDKIGLAWSDDGAAPKIDRIYLPHAGESMKDRILRDYPDVKKTSRRIPGGLAEIIAGLYRGEALKFDLSRLNWSGWGGFSGRVLRQTFKIPRGKVYTYAGLAAKAGSPGAARAAGSVMAKNPFPLVIPCHRVIRSDGFLGRFGGGTDMKKQLLEKEGMGLDEKGRVPSTYID